MNPEIQQEQTFNFSLQLTETNTILQALSHFPYKEVAPIIQKIQNQVVAQLPDEENTNQATKKN
jgi:hypothetical protein